MWPHSAPGLLLGGVALSASIAGQSGAAFFTPLVGRDSDRDGILDPCDNCELPNPGQEDCDGDGIGDRCAIELGLAPDCDGNGIVDACDPDCDGNGVADACDLAGGAADCDGDGVPDLCQLATQDCDGNGIPDACDVAAGRLTDCDGNGVPDECEGGFDTLYILDDGAPQWAFGAGGPLPMVWLNAFEVRPHESIITAIEIGWGVTSSVTGATIALWRDPDNDGDPANAWLLFSQPVTIVNPGNYQTQRFEIPWTIVGAPGEIFFVGASIAPGTAAAAADGFPQTSGSSWLTTASNLANLAATTPPQPLGVSLPPANWLIRAVATGVDGNGNGVVDACEDGADIDGDGVVGGVDLTLLLGAWGPCPGCAADIDGNGIVDGSDLTLLLGAWSR